MAGHDRNDAKRGGLALMAATGLALGLANGPWSGDYGRALDLTFTVGLGDAALAKPLLHWINDGLMAVFFLLIGLEIRREMKGGELSDPRRIALPVAGAIGGVVLPVAIYLGVTAGDPTARAGWAIPAATDIAFALGVLALFGSRIPAALTVFLATLAVIDDLFAILAIALFYSDGLTFGALLGAVAVFAALLVAGRRGVASRWVHLFGFALIWFLMLKSGLHATMAGVLAAFTFPLHDSDRAASCPARTLERDLARPVAFFILPLFALANAGISLDGVRMGDLLEGATLGTILGLALGKPVGILAACALAVRLGWARLPSGVSRSMLAGAAMICGIGFTMSLFIGALAFRGAPGAVDPRLGILLGSALAAGAGALTLRRAVAVPSPAPARRAARSIVDATG